MQLPYVALVEDTALFDKDVHARWDFFPLKLVVKQKESSFAEVEMDILRPEGGLSSIQNRRIIVNQSGHVLLDGIVSMVPQGIIGEVLTLKIDARPAKREVFDAQIAQLADDLKVAPYWEPLCVQKGKENDWPEILAARTQVVNYSRNKSQPFLTDAIATDDVIRIYPFDGSVRYTTKPGVAKKYGVRLEANWKQLVLQVLDDAQSLRDLETMTPDGLVANFPKVAAQVGDGFTVIDSRAKVNMRRGMPVIEKSVSVEVPVDSGELDPAFIEEGSQILKGDVVKVDTRLRVRYLDRIPRLERVEISAPVLVQKAALNEEENWEDLPVQDFTEPAQAQPWRPGFYKADTLVADGDKIYRARIDHTSLSQRMPSDWIQVGESRYIESRTISSFFKSTRGRDVLEHALKRMEARATMDARCVLVSFECAMPAKPWQVGFGMTLYMESERLPGGYAKGRLVEYALSWDNGEMIFGGTIACVPGVPGQFAAPILGPSSGTVLPALGRMRVEVTNNANEQEEALLAGAREIPPTVITVNTTPVPSSGFEQDIKVPVSNSFSFPQDALI